MTLVNYIRENKERASGHLLRTFSYGEQADGDIFYHLCFCVLVPAGRADKARYVVNKLKEWDYYNESISVDNLLTLLKSNIRFPKQKAERLVQLHHKLYVIETLHEFVDMQMPVVTVREYLVEHIAGLGYKAASHFMRNIGFQQVAIIDTHIMKYRELFLPYAQKDYEPTTKAKYLFMESYFNAWAEELEVTPVCLDWLLWCREGGYEIESFTY